jgi:hypothetical protein
LLFFAVSSKDTHFYTVGVAVRRRKCCE